MSSILVVAIAPQQASAAQSCS